MLQSRPIETAALLVPPARASRYVTPQFELSIWQPVQGLVIQKAAGHATASVAHALIHRLSGMVATGRLLIFDDWEKVTGYDSDARVLMSDWTRRNLACIERIHALVGSKLVAMAISVSNLVTGGISTSYTHRHLFENVLAREVRQRGG